MAGKSFVYSLVFKASSPFMCCCMSMASFVSSLVDAHVTAVQVKSEQEVTQEHVRWTVVQLFEDNGRQQLNIMIIHSDGNGRAMLHY